MATLGQYEYVEIVTWPEAFRKRKQNTSKKGNRRMFSVANEAKR